MDKVIFDRALNSLLALKDVPANKDKSASYFKMMKDDFTNEEFDGICRDICKTEKLYNKYPDICLFYQRKPQSTHFDQMQTEKQKFLGRVGDYLGPGFVSSYDRKEFAENITENEMRVLQRHGGIAALWESCHREDYARSVDSILRNLADDFEALWQAENKNKLQLSYGNQAAIEKLANSLLEHWKI